MSYVGPKWFYQILGRYLISTFSTVCNFRQRGTSYQAMYILLGLDSSTLNIPYWDFKYKHNLQGLQKCEYKHNLLGLRKCEYKHNLLGLPKVSKNTPWWELCTHLDRKILFQSLECAKDKKCHLPVPKWDFFMWGIKMISI